MIFGKLGRRKVLITGIPLFIEKTAQLIENNVWRARAVNTESPKTKVKRQLRSLGMLRHLPSYDAVYQIGGPIVVPYLLHAAKALGKPIILHWVGSDVLQAMRTVGEEVRLQDRTGSLIHWVDAPWLADELKVVGIKSTVLPLCAVPDACPTPMPGGPLTVLLYLPDERFDFYGGPTMMAVARQLPDVQFLVVGGRGKNKKAPPNVTFLGWIPDMETVYARCHCFVRLANHDGLSFMVAEALGQGRHVFWNYELPGVTTITHESEIIHGLTALRRQQFEGNLPLNAAGRTYVAETFDARSVAKRIRLGLDEAIRSHSGPQAGKRALVCGLPIFAARAASTLRASGWRVRLVNTGAPKSRIDDRIALLKAVASVPFNDIVYQIGGPVVYPQLLQACRKFRRPVVLHWAGTDVLQVTTRPNGIARMDGQPGLVKHWAVAPWLVEELESVGIHSTYVPPNAVLDVNVPPLPQGRLHALVYLPEVDAHNPTGGSYEFYGGGAIARIAQKIPDVTFLCVGGHGLDKTPPANMLFVGWQRDMQAIYGKCHVLIRLTKHDGLSNMVTEALNYGRYVIWIYPFTGVLQAKNQEELEAHLIMLRDKHNAGELGLNQTGMSYVRANFHISSIKAQIARRLEEASLEYRVG